MKLSPARPEARDEGPRILPLEVSDKRSQFGRRALELADIALGHTAPKKPKKKP